MKEAQRKNKENKLERECVEKMSLREMKIKGQSVTQFVVTN